MRHGDLGGLRALLSCLFLAHSLFLCYISPDGHREQQTTLYIFEGCNHILHLSLFPYIFPYMGKHPMILQSSWKVRFSKFWTVPILLLLASPHHSWNLTPRTTLHSTSNTLDSFKTLQFSCTPHTYTEISISPPAPLCIIYWFHGI